MSKTETTDYEAQAKEVIARMNAMAKALGYEEGSKDYNDYKERVKSDFANTQARADAFTKAFNEEMTFRKNPKFFLRVSAASAVGFFAAALTTLGGFALLSMRKNKKAISEAAGSEADLYSDPTIATDRPLKAI